MPELIPTDDCAHTTAIAQAVLDGDRPAADLDAHAHAATCADCRARVAEVRVLLAALAFPPEPATVPAGFAAGVLSAVRADGRARRRLRVLASVGGLAVAAALLVGVWVMKAPTATQVVAEGTRCAPEPPVRVSEEFAKAGDALRESSRPITEPAAAAPKVLASLAEAMFPPLPAPMGEVASPAAVSLAEIPTAARAGLEPVTGTTQKAFTRLLRDVNVFSARPKS